MLIGPRSATQPIPAFGPPPLQPLIYLRRCPCKVPVAVACPNEYPTLKAATNNVSSNGKHRLT
jgi:hypothetical protein